jgi:hypothetical protein
MSRTVTCLLALVFAFAVTTPAHAQTHARPNQTHA